MVALELDSRSASLVQEGNKAAYQEKEKPYSAPGEEQSKEATEPDSKVGS